MNPIIALWAHPRSMSTATERVMRERGDLDCFHEPFMYDYYVHRKIREMPHFAAEDDRPVSYEAVRAMLLARAETRPVFIKDMSYYVMPRIIADTELGARLTNCFLIRNPVASILSYFKLDPDATCEEIGIEAQALHYRALRDAGQNPPVIQAEDIRNDTPRALGALWRAIGLPPADHAFAWQDDHPEDWKQVDGWHGKVSASNAIRPLSPEEEAAQQEDFARLARDHPRALELLEHHRPHYEMLRSNALTFRP